jgi:hypothetical protein
VRARFNRPLHHNRACEGDRAHRYARVGNITDELAYSAASSLTTTAYPDAALPARSLKVGTRVNFQTTQATDPRLGSRGITRQTQLQRYSVLGF